MTATPVEAPYEWEPLGPDGIARCRFNTGAVITEAVARRTMVDLGALTGGKRPPLLADIRKMKSLTREGRVYYDTVTDRFSALALLAASPATRLIANFFIGMSRPKVPTQMFTSEETALVWLRRYVV